MINLVVAGLLAMLMTPQAESQERPQHERIRGLYMNAVHSSAAIAPAESAIQSLLAKSKPGSHDEALLTAYSGAVRTLRAKHGRWPRSRLRNLREGLRVLDRVAESHPDIAEIRYLRLMSCYYLPGILGRGWSVNKDFQALASLLPGEKDELPPDLYREVAVFVLEHGDLSPHERQALSPSLGP